MLNERPLTIVQVGAFPFPAPHGSQVYVSGMCRALARRGHHVRLVCYAPGSGELPDGVDVLRARPIPGGAFTSSGPHWSRPLHDLALVRAVRRARAGADVVHAHHVEGVAVARLALPGVPVVYNQHASLADELPQWSPGRRVARWVGRAADACAPRLGHASIALSEAGRENLVHHGARRVELIPPGIDLADIEGADRARARQVWNLGARDWVVYTGNADPYQDLDVLFRAVARLETAGLLFVTPADPGPWERLADAVGLPSERRRIVRSGSFADAKDALAAGTVAALPRTRCAGFPIKLLNALALGLPTVVAAGSAQPIDGVVSVPNGDSLAMAAAIEALLADVGRRGGLRQAARAHVRRAWTWDAQAARLEALYRSLGR